MRSYDPNRRLRNLIYQRMEDEIALVRRQADSAGQASQAKVEWILKDLERQRLQADLDSQKKEEEKQKRILKHQRLRRYVREHFNDYVHEHVHDYVHERINDYVHERVNEMWDKYQTDEEFRERVNESIKRSLAALGRAYASLKGTAVSETTGSPMGADPLEVPDLVSKRMMGHAAMVLGSWYRA